jgi:hypothetical protein
MRFDVNLYEVDMMRVLKHLLLAERVATTPLGPRDVLTLVCCAFVPRDFLLEANGEAYQSACRVLI